MTGAGRGTQGKHAQVAMGHDRHVPTAGTGRSARPPAGPDWPPAPGSPRVCFRHDTVLEDCPVGLREFADLHRGEALVAAVVPPIRSSEVRGQAGQLRFDEPSSGGRAQREREAAPRERTPHGIRILLALGGSGEVSAAGVCCRCGSTRWMPPDQGRDGPWAYWCSRLKTRLRTWSRSRFGGTGTGHREVQLCRTAHRGVRRRERARWRIHIGTGEGADHPVELLLAAIAGCSAVDVDFITGKRPSRSARGAQRGREGRGRAGQPPRRHRRDLHGDLPRGRGRRPGAGDAAEVDPDVARSVVHGQPHGAARTPIAMRAVD